MLPMQGPDEKLNYVSCYSGSVSPKYSSQEIYIVVSPKGKFYLIYSYFSSIFQNILVTDQFSPLNLKKLSLHYLEKSYRC